MASGRNAYHNSFADTGLSVGTYSYTVAARDAAGKKPLARSTSASVTIADTTPPSTPTGLTAAAAGSTGANCRGRLRPQRAVTGYIVRRNGPGRERHPSFADTGLSAATTYSYTVAAFDAAGNTSANSASASVTIADTTPPLYAHRPHRCRGGFDRSQPVLERFQPTTSG